MSDGSRGFVLVAGATPDSLQQLVAILESEGYSARTADSGEAAIDLAMAEPPDVVVLDMQMTGVDGLQVFRQLRGDARTHDIPVIFASSSKDAAQWREALELGVADFVTKPVDRVKLIARVAAQVGLSRLRTLAQQQADELSLISERLEAESAKRSQSEQKVAAAELADANLAGAAMALLSCQSADEIYDVICEFMLLVAPDSVIVVNETTPDAEMLITRRVEGLGSKLLEKASELVGFEITGGRQAIAPTYRQDLLGVNLRAVPGGFQELASVAIPRVLAAAVAKTFRLHDAFSIGIASGEVARGNIQIYTRAPGVVLPAHLIESFTHTCYSALDGLAKAAELAESAERNSLVLRNMLEGLALPASFLSSHTRMCSRPE